MSHSTVSGSQYCRLFRSAKRIVVLLVVKLTSHLGDSGIKNRPGIKSVQGKIPY
ncbi:unnamed protein product [Spirodela intermedia]|uniref:Uncharacterized protein n=2 Tax=Spirodela intermedia TaxID=51605 RepID=A0A7I8JSY5_SPIIN|nr:unnamed protein product [Spirodela intermedia]CAA6673234.1 unnamed protein product [Spirodela intermedia]CAA7410458.1 unnamed protein product [Spirodela intermedia]